MRNSMTAFIAAVSFLFAPVSIAQQRTMVLSIFGINQPLFDKHLYAPFKAKCNCNIIFETGNASERLAKLEARKDNPVVDVAALPDFTTLEARQKGLIQPLDTKRLPNMGLLYDFAKNPVGSRSENFGVGYTVYATSIVYRSDKIEAIKSWKDLFRPELKGRIALPNITTTQGPLLLFMMDRAWGGQGNQFDVGFKKLAELKGNILTFYEPTPLPATLFAQDEIYATVIGRWAWPGLIRTKKPLKWAAPVEGQTGGLNLLTLVKGSKNAALVHEFIDFWLSTEVQTNLAKALVDSPTNKEVRLPPEQAELMTYGQEQINAIRFLPPDAVLKERAAWVEKWNSKIAR